MRLFASLILVFSTIAAFGAISALFLQLSDSTAPHHLTEIESAQVIEQRLNNVVAMLESMQNRSAATDLSDDLAATRAELSELNEKLKTLDDQRDGTSQFSIIFSIVSGLAWWGVIFLVSAPVLASMLSNAFWEKRGFRTLSVIVFLLGIVGSVSTIGVLYAEMASDFVEQFGWAAPPILVGTAFATFASVTLRVKGITINLIGSSILSFGSVVISALIFLICMPRPESCEAALDLSCKIPAIFSQVEITPYLLSFAALLLALFFYFVSALVLMRSAAAGWIQRGRLS